MTNTEQALQAFEEWYDSLPTYAIAGNGPAKGTIAGALVVLEHLKADYNLDIEDHLAKSGTQIRGASGKAVAGILARFGETRRYLSEGGRTNRGLRKDIEPLLAALETLSLDGLSESDRKRVLGEMQGFLVERVRAFFNRQRIKFQFEPSKSVWQLLHNILETAKVRGQEGPVAQYLVGAKLTLRFPEREIVNLSYSTADVQTDRPGDFALEDTAFHVTVAPQSGLFDKCKQNLQDGLRPYILVPGGMQVGIRQLADRVAPGQITVTSVESFVAQNVEELSCFSNKQLVTGLRALLEKYNERTDEAENDKSMLIRIPANLQG